MEQCIALRAARATEEATFISKWLLWVTAGSLLASTSALIALYFTYRQGQYALRVAGTANRISDRNGQAQARAYVVLQSVEGNLSIESHERVRLSVKLLFHNSGLSPALRLKTLSVVSLAVHKGDESVQGVTAGEEFDLSESHWQQDIGAGQSWSPIGTSWILPKGAEIYSLICHNEAFNAVIVKTLFQYEDVFGVFHKETACFQGHIAHVDPGGTYTMLERGPDDVYDQQASRRAPKTDSDTPA
ncbi:hypothetical protein C0U40_19975 [Amylibacter cionae]|nr:hypothetical protein C0U40_19975 [Amylibacter cionae]